MQTIAKRAFLHFAANCDNAGRVPNLTDITEQLREEFPRRAVVEPYVRHKLYAQWRQEHQIPT